MMLFYKNLFPQFYLITDWRHNDWYYITYYVCV